MYQRPTSPYHPPSSPYSPPSQGQGGIVPGSITYTTTTGPDGKTVYHPFKSVEFYQTPSGIVHGIQWVPAEATQILPPGAQPATPEFSASTGKGSESSISLQPAKRYPCNRHRDDDKRRKEKEAKRFREEQELKHARERDAQARERRKSFIAGSTPGTAGAAGAGGGFAFPTAGAGGHSGAYNTSPYPPQAPYPPRDRKYSTGGTAHSELDRHFGEMDIGGSVRPRKYSTSEPPGFERPRTVSGNFGVLPGVNSYGSNAATLATSGPYSRPYSSAAGSQGPPYANPSPNMRAADVPPLTASGYPSSPYSSGIKQPEPQMRPTTPYGHGQSVYGQSRSRATSPIPGVGSGPVYPQPRSRATTPIPGTSPPVAFPQPVPSPRIPDMPFMDKHNQPMLPESFSRPVNPSFPYAPFDTIKIQDMDDFLERLPKLPLVLSSHDVTHHDWIRMVQDLSLAWAGKMPIPADRVAHPPKRTSIIAELLDTWNAAFFLPRGVEVILYKGRVRYSGPKAGIADLDHSQEDDDEDDVSTASSTEESDDDPYYGAAPGAGLYGRAYARPPTMPYSPDVLEARRRRKEERAERRRRRRERRLRRKQRARERKITVYVSYVPMGAPGSMPGGYPGSSRSTHSGSGY
ncbi:hypothetical protein AMATHDRAFT_74099 [Amanita thiersii Skay4041]|uniref:Uncharacterized protein n=1 Tax=Amanita thiersii Skay4041 TaxID=703135 RepID=A0A2A9NXI8_9AGAR|nr:hypothetical protein AMATHDRAFT_74099 [Amanita thiersii Skay4041]